MAYYVTLGKPDGRASLAPTDWRARADTYWEFTGYCVKAPLLPLLCFFVPGAAVVFPLLLVVAAIVFPWVFCGALICEVVCWWKGRA